MQFAAAAMQPSPRTLDVLSGIKSFAGLLLPPAIEQALREAGFLRPSPVQEAALPLARMGTDLIVQAKAGTGKTLVFAVAAVERVDLTNSAPQVLVLAPTREIALQASETIALVASALPVPGLSCSSFIGGLPLQEDEKQLRRACHVVVGTTGRVLDLLQRGTLRLGSVRLLVLDEADKLLADSFSQDTLAILAATPQRRQLLALSATFAPAALGTLRSLMGGRQQEVLLCAGDTSLLGVRQFYKFVGGSGSEGAASLVPEQQQQQQQQQQDERPSDSSAAWLQARMGALQQLLSAVSFQQAVVFCKYRSDAEAVAQQLQAAGYPCACLSAQRTQLQRIEAINALRDFRLRVAVTTDLAARGVDLERVNLVINLTLPQEAATYMHRVGRAGRFGTRGMAITLLAGAAELQRLQAHLAHMAGGQVTELPAVVSPEWYFQQSDAAAGSGGGSGAAGAVSMSPPTPAAAANLLAAAGDSLGSDGAGPLADIATASLWMDEEGKEEAAVELEMLEPQQQPQQQRHQQQQPEATEAMEEEEAAGIDLRYSVVPKPPLAALSATAAAAEAGAMAAPLPPSTTALQQQQQQKPAVKSSLTVAVAAADAAAAAAHSSAAGSPRHTCSTANSAGSWESTSDDDYSGSSGSDGEYAAAAAAAATPARSLFSPSASLSGVGSRGDGLVSPQLTFKSPRRSGSQASSSSGSGGGRRRSPPAPIPGRSSYPADGGMDPLLSHSYEGPGTGLAAVLAEPLSSTGTDAGSSDSPRSPAAVCARAAVSNTEEEPSFKDSWLAEEQQQAEAAEKVKGRQQRHAAATATEAAASSSFELRPHRRRPREVGSSGGAAAARTAAAEPQQAQQGHYWHVVRSVEQDVQGRLGSGGSGSAAASRATAPSGQAGAAAAFVPVVPRQRRPLSSAQASAARRQQEEAAIAAAAEVAQDAAVQRMAEQHEAAVGVSPVAGITGADPADGEERQRQWSEFWMSHYAYYGCYPAEGLFSASADAAPGPSSTSTSSQQAPGPAAAAAGSVSLLPPPPAPPSPPPQLSTAAWAGQLQPGTGQGVAAGSGGPSSGDGSWVQVPSALLSRYQQLEWEQWHRQYIEWQTVWEQYKSYWAQLYEQQQQQEPQPEQQLQQ